MEKRIVLVLGLVLLLVASPAKGQQLTPEEQIKQAVYVIEEAMKGKGEVNWTAGYIQAVGEGYPAKWATDHARKLGSARAAAIVVAERNLLAAIKGITIDSVTKIENQAIASDLILKQVKGILKGAQVVKELTKVEEFPDGSIKVSATVRMPIYGKGGLADVVQPLPGGALPSNVRPYWATADNPFDLTKIPAEIKKPLPEVYTGLIIDTRGLQLHPAMAPKILTENGMEVYGTAFVNRDYTISQGIVGYAKGLDFAKKMERVTDNPLIVKAIKSAGTKKTDVVVSLEDAYKIEKLKQRQSFLDQCRVVFLVD